MDSITRNKIKPSKLIKNINNDEIINEEYLDVKFPKRKLTDVSTSIFTQVFFAEDKNYQLFLNYYNFLDVILNYEVNLKLLNLNLIPLDSDEDISMIFKGGNVMNYHFNKLIHNKELKERFNEFFRKSDFDFNANIITSSSLRFEILKDCTYPFIISFLTKTVNSFNDYLSKILSGKEIFVVNHEINDFYNEKYNYEYKRIILSIKEFIKNNDMESFKEFFIKFRDIIPKITKQNINENIKSYEFLNGFKLSYYSSNNGIINNEMIEFYNNEILDHAFTFYLKCKQKSKYHGILLYPYVKFFITEINDDYSLLLEKMREYNFNLLVLNKFYSKDKLSEYIFNIKNKLNEMKGETFYESNEENIPPVKDRFNPEFYDTYKIENDNIRFEKKKNFILYNDIDYIKNPRLVEYSSSENNYHYVSINYSIIAKSQAQTYVNFDLFRIKFNTIISQGIEKNNKLSKSFPIPSEFVDIAVPDISDSKRDDEDFIIKLTIPEIKYPNVKSYSFDHFIHDISNILFIGAPIPWIKPKYEKRIIRLLILIYLNDKYKKTTFLSTTKLLVEEILNNKKISIENITSLKKYIHYDNFFLLCNLPHKYDLVSHFYKFLIITYKSIRENLFCPILNKYSKIVNTINECDKQGFITFNETILNEINKIEQLK